MNRYPLWKYLTIAVVTLLALLYALPNLFSEAPAIQVSAVSGRAQLDAASLQSIEAALNAAGIRATRMNFEPAQGARSARIEAQFADVETQLHAKDVLERALNAATDKPANSSGSGSATGGETEASYIIALRLASRSPRWMAALGAQPMNLGLDLRGGTHFLLQIDMQTALTQKLDALALDLKRAAEEKGAPQADLRVEGQTLIWQLAPGQTARAAEKIVSDLSNDVRLSATQSAGGAQLRYELKPEAQFNVRDTAVKQNLTTLHNRVNELGVAEPVIQRQGSERIVVQLPGVQDAARAKSILGRTASLEFRMVEDSALARMAAAGKAPMPFGLERGLDRQGRAIALKSEVVLTGKSLTDAQPGFDNQTQEPAVHLTLDAKGARIFRDLTARNVGKQMAILLVERGRKEVVTAPVIRSEIPGGRVQISGAMTSAEAADVALLLRAGSLAAPMEIIEERTIGPSLGQENITRGLNAVRFGLLAVAGFMCLYYLLIGAFSALALTLNLLMLVAVLSLLQATLTLPGMAAMALVLGMAIDSNVLINERIREELRNGMSAQAAIDAGYARAWATILDSNVTTLIAGIALLVFGSGPVRGFAVVHCLGILTSMFSAVFFSRGLINFWYGSRRRLGGLSIGQVWRPDGGAVATGGTAVTRN